MIKISPRLVLLIFVCFFLSCEKDNDSSANQLPTADAGSSGSITLPVDNVILTGSGTDADGKVVAFLWSEVSGPNAANIINPGSPSTPAKGFMEGTYLFQLMVTDDH